MPSTLIRKAVWAIVAAIIVVALAFSALPYFASTRIVRDRIAWEMSAWSGFRVAIDGAPQIQIWPKFSAVLTDVTLSEWTETDQPPVIEAERVEIDLSALAALRGDVVFSATRLIRPTLRVDTAANGLLLPAAPTGGRIARAIDNARAVVQAAPTDPDISKLPADAFGMVEFRDGRIVTLVNGAETDVVTSLTGQASWPALNAGGTLSATGIWHGESVAMEVSSARPLLLFAGGSAPVAMSLKAAPASFSFSGNAGLSGNAFLNGQVKFSAPSLRRTLEWSGLGIAPGAAVGAVAISSRVSASAGRMKFDNAEISLDKNPGAGALDLSFSEAVPVASGTLAFETLDLRAFLSAFTPLVPDGQVPNEIDTSFADRLNLDIRVSAARATAGAIQLADVAATAQVKDGLSVFDISDAAAFGGRIQTSLRFDRKPDGTQMEMKLLASDINGAAFGKAAGMTQMVPTGTGTVSIILKGPGKAWDSVLENADGSFSATFGPGKLTGFNLPAFRQRSEEGGFFALAEVADGTLPIDGAELKATIARGVARLDKAEVRSGQTRIWLSGIVPYSGRGLALTGGMTPELAAQTQDQADPQTDANAAARADAPGQTASFFVGGTWSRPFISPIVRRGADQ